MANRDIRVQLEDSSGNSLEGVTKSASFDTGWYSLNGAEYFGFILNLGAISGTSPTINIDVEFTMDGGTTVWTEFPNAPNAESITGVTTNAGVFTEISTSDQQASVYYVNPFPNNNNCKVRLEVTFGGSSPTVVINDAYLIARRWGKY
jgi:hypothetical protein